MSVSTRAKFRCFEVNDYGFSKKVVLRPVYAPGEDGTAEDRGFTKATPSGELWMTIDNPAAACQFEPQAEYYIDIHRVPDKTAPHS